MRAGGRCDPTCAPRTPRSRSRGRCVAAAIAVLLAAAPAAAQETPYAATSRGASCNLEADGSLSCRYVVGRDLEFVLRRVAERQVKLEIVRADPAGDYTIEPALLGQCVLVRFGAGVSMPGAGYVYATVSGKNGLVYRSLHECRASR